MATKYKFLNFYNKSGDNLNLDYDSDLGLLTGRVHIPKVSTDLIESYQIFISEEFKASAGAATTTFGLPHIFNGAGATSAVNVSWVDDKTPELFLYSFDATAENILLTKSTSQEVTFDIDSTETIETTGATGMKITSNITDNVIALNIGFCPKQDIAYENVLQLKDSHTNEVFAKITFYGEGIEEDKRLAVMLDNFGWNINARDFKIFQSTDINEDIPDNQKLNTKRKELLLEFENIFPYLGSYKALINIVKYFGYDNVKLKEYWKNIEIESVNFGKYRHTDIVDIFSNDGDPNVSEKFIPNKFYKKTSKFGLFYNITEWDGKYDDDGLPTVIESNEFSLEEVLIKLFALKQKLKTHFLPMNARIVDIIGEAIYFTKYDINSWVDQTRIDKIDLNIRPDVKVLPSDFGYIEDLRPLNHLGCPIAPDLSIGGTHSLHIYNFTIANADEGDKFVIRDTTTNNSIEYTTQFSENDAETLLGLVDAWNASPNYPFINFKVYPFGATANGVMRVVEQYPTTFNYVFDITQGTSSGTPSTIVETELFMGASAISDYADCFIGYFTGAQIPVNELSDAEGIPVGYPIVLDNNSLTIPWDEMTLTWNSLDETEITSGSDNFGLPLYGPFTTSFSSLTVSAGSTYTPVPAAGFPTGIYATTPSSAQYQWYNVERMNFYEMQWVVTCTESNTVGASGWVHDTGYQSIDLLDKYPLVLPYTGKYRLEMRMRDLFNGITYLKTDNFVEVEAKKPNFIAWHESIKPKYTWDDTREPRKTKAINDNKLSNMLSWNDYNSSWNIPVHPNEELDMAEMTYEFLDKIEFAQRQFNEIPTDPRIDITPYFWNNLGEQSTWDDTSALYWDYCDPTLVQFSIDTITSTTPTITLTHPVLGKKSAFTFDNLGTDPYDKFKNAVKQLNENVGASAINTNLIGPVGDDTVNLFDIFIFHYDFKYDNAFGTGVHSHNFVPSIKAISKNIEVPNRIEITYTDITGDSSPYHANVQTLGDIPTGFEIYTAPVGSTFSINNGTVFTVGSTVTDLSILADELNLSTGPEISKFDYTVITGYTGGTHLGTGATGMTLAGNAFNKIIATDKGFNSYDTVNIQYGSTMIGTSYGRNITTNPTYDTLRSIKYSDTLKNLVRGNFTYDNSSVPGGVKPVWKITKENDNQWVDIYYRNEYLSYLFNQKGSYTFSLELEDTNGNKSNIIKNEFIKII